MSNTKTFYCNVCQCGFDRKFNYEQHLKSKKHNIRVSNDKPQLYNCSFCKKNFSYSSGLYRHRSKCKLNCVPTQKVDYLEKENLELHKKNLELSQKIEDLEKSKNNTNTIQTQNNTKIQTQNNTNIQKQKNNIIINCFGNENLDYITDKVILHCMNKIYGAIPLLIEKIHFDPEHPENHNIQIPNKKLPHAKIMNNKSEWQFVNKKEAVESMIDQGYNILDEKFHEKSLEMAENKQKHFRNFQTKYEDGDKNTIRDIKDKVEMLVINKSREKT